MAATTKYLSDKWEAPDGIGLTRALDVEALMEAVIDDLSRGHMDANTASQIGFCVDRIQRDREIKAHYAAIAAGNQS